MSPPWIARCSLAAGFLVGLVGALISDGAYHDDDITHFIMAREAIHDAAIALDWWGRPGYTLPTMLVAPLGLFWARMMSLVFTTATCWMAWRIGVRLVGERDAAWVPALFWLQPLVFTLSITTLTETPAGFYLTAAVLLHLRGHNVWACLAMSPTFVTRYETLVLGAVFGLYLLWLQWRREGARALISPTLWVCAVALLWAPAAYVALSIGLEVPDARSPLGILTREYTTEYGAGPWHHMLARWPEAAGVGILALATTGALRLGSRGGAVTLLAISMLVLQGSIYTLGAFASGGYARFLVPAGGLVAVLASVGLSAAVRGDRRRAASLTLLGVAFWPLVVAARFEWIAKYWPVLVPAALLCVALAFAVHRGRLRPAVAVVVTLLVIGAQWAVEVYPLRLERSPYHQALHQTAQALPSEPEVFSQHFVLRWWRPNVRIFPGNDAAAEAFVSAPPGRLYVWETKYSVKAHEPESTRRLETALEAHGDRLFTVRDRGAEVRIYERRPDSRNSSTAL